MASPFCEKYWSWFKEKQAEGFEIISFALRRPPFTTLPLEQIEFAGKVNVGVVLQNYLVHSSPINWAAMCVSSRESRESQSLGNVIFNILESHVFKKYSKCWVLSLSLSL